MSLFSERLLVVTAAAGLSTSVSDTFAPWMAADGSSMLGFAPNDDATVLKAAATCEILFGAPAAGADACGAAQFFADEAALVAAGSDEQSLTPVPMFNMFPSNFLRFLGVLTIQ